MRNDVRDKLINVARNGNTINYKELMKEFGIPRGNPKPGIGIGHVVGIISDYEFAKHRPRLSAIVVRKYSECTICPKGNPGLGFFSLDGIPSELKLNENEYKKPRPLSNKEKEFVRDEQIKVWEYWKNK